MKNVCSVHACLKKTEQCDLVISHMNFQDTWAFHKVFKISIAKLFPNLGILNGRKLKKLIKLENNRIG